MRAVPENAATVPRLPPRPLPRIEAIDLHYEYPGFTGLAPRDELDGGDIYAPVGTRVRLRVRAAGPVAAAHVALGSASLPATRIDARTFESTLTLARAGSYRASVQDARGLRGDSLEYLIRLATDRPPEIHIVRPAGDQGITPLEEVTIEAKAEDDFGIASMDMVFAVAGGQEHVVPVPTCQRNRYGTCRLALLPRRNWVSNPETSSRITRAPATSRTRNLPQSRTVRSTSSR